MLCPLCQSEKTRFKLNSRDQDYHHCQRCDLIFVPPEFHVSIEKEKQIYDTHQNTPDNLGYLNFLSELSEPLIKILKSGMTGLDFGSGPGPTLNSLFKKAGFDIDLYDPYYAPYPEKLNVQYDFVTATEVVEHFSKPKEAWGQLVSLVKPNSYLGIMTLLHDANTDFESWWYKNDATHVHFYSAKTIEWLTDYFKLSVELIGKRVALFTTNPGKRSAPRRNPPAA